MVRPAKSTIVTLSIIFLVLVIASWYAYSVIQSRQGDGVVENPAVSALSAKAGESGYTDINGNVVTLDSYLGQVLVVTSWASWCPACAQTLPAFSELGKLYENKGVAVLAINRAEPGSTAQAFLRAIQATDGLTLVLDPGDRYFTAIGGYDMPETVFYDSSGNIVFHKRGQMNLEEMRVQVSAALGNSSANE